MCRRIALAPSRRTWNPRYGRGRHRACPGGGGTRLDAQPRLHPRFASTLVCAVRYGGDARPDRMGTRRGAPRRAHRPAVWAVPPGRTGDAGRLRAIRGAGARGAGSGERGRAPGVGARLRPRRHGSVLPAFRRHRTRRRSRRASLRLRGADGRRAIQRRSGVCEPRHSFGAPRHRASAPSLHEGEHEDEHRGERTSCAGHDRPTRRIEALRSRIRLPRLGKCSRVAGFDHGHTRAHGGRRARSSGGQAPSG